MSQSYYSELVTTKQLVKKSSWIMNILVAIDQLGNAITGGNPDSTISARIGYFMSICTGSLKKYWRFLEAVVDFTFQPIDGKKHCKQAYESDKEEYFNKGNILTRVVLLIIVVLVCIPLIILIYIGAFLFPKIKNKYELNGESISIKQINEIRLKY